MNASVFSAAFLLLSLASSAVYAAPSDEVPDPPDVPKLNTQPWVPARYKAVRENLLGKECGILFVGDSITECWEREGSALWKRLFVPMKAVNFGVSGDRTDSMLWRMEDTGLAVRTSPRYCILLAGTNNIGLWKGRQPAEAGRDVQGGHVQGSCPFNGEGLSGMGGRVAAAVERGRVSFPRFPAARHGLEGGRRIAARMTRRPSVPFPFPGIPAGRPGTGVPW